jgi:hypothetical protein
MRIIKIIIAISILIIFRRLVTHIDSSGCLVRASSRTEKNLYFFNRISDYYETSS